MGSGRIMIEGTPVELKVKYGGKTSFLTKDIDRADLQDYDVDITGEGDFQLINTKGKQVK